MNASESDRTFNTRAPAREKASAMPSAIKGSSSQMRIEQPAKLALLMVVSRGAAKRELPRQGRPLAMGRTVSRAVDQSSERAASAMIDVEGRTRLAGQGSVLRACRMISVGKIAALTQVRMRADLTTFFGSLRRAQELVERGAVGSMD
jgi:hypothetical protein